MACGIDANFPSIKSGDPHLDTTIKLIESETITEREKDGTVSCYFVLRHHFPSTSFLLVPFWLVDAFLQRMAWRSAVEPL